MSEETNWQPKSEKLQDTEQVEVNKREDVPEGLPETDVEANEQPVVSLDDGYTVIQSQVREVFQIEALRQRLAGFRGVHVQGESFSPGTGQKTKEILQEPKAALRQGAEEGLIDITPDEVEVLSEETAREIVSRKALELAEQSPRTIQRREETKHLRELEVDRINLHFGHGFQRLSNIVTPGGEVIAEELADFEGFKEYYERLKKEGVHVEFSLGPGLEEYRTADGEMVINTTRVVDPETGRLQEQTTEYKFPLSEDERRVWENYCKFMVEHFPEADFTVWVEPNLNRDDIMTELPDKQKGIWKPGIFSAEGRSPEKYAELVAMTAGFVKEVEPEAKVGLNAVFIDIDFLTETLEHVEELTGEIPVDYVTINTYRDQPEIATPYWDDELASFRQQAGMEEAPRGSFNWEARLDDNGEPITYEEEIIRLYQSVAESGITDIRTGETGWGWESLSDQQKATYGLRGWILDRYLWLQETLWKMSNASGSEGQYGLLDEDGEPNASYHAYKNFNRIFHEDVVPVRELNTGNEKILGRVFKDEESDQELVALWVSNNFDEEAHVSKVLPIKHEESEDLEILSDLSNEKDALEWQPVTRDQLEVTEEPVILRRSLQKS